MRLPPWIEHLPTPAKLLLFLSLALLPIGGVLVWTASSALNAAKEATRENARLDSSMLSDSIEGLIARNALALRIAANAALDGSGGDRCQIAARSLAIAPAVAREFELEGLDGEPLCATPNYVGTAESPLVAPGAIRLWIAADGASLLVRTGVVRGSATTRIPLGALVELANDDPHLLSASLGDGSNTLPLVVRPSSLENDRRAQADRLKLAGDRLELVSVSELDPISASDKATILLPVLMWALAGLLSWALVHRLLIGPLRRLQNRVGAFAPGDDTAMLVEDRYGAANETRDLAASFADALHRIDEGEKKMGEALEGQRRLVRVVHHRV